MPSEELQNQSQSERPASNQTGIIIMPSRSPRSKIKATSDQPADKPSPKASPSGSATNGVSPAKKNPIKRRDATGHIDPRYARELLAKARETHNGDDDPEATHAFLKGARTADELAEERGENFLETVTSGEGQEAERHDQITADEVGGPFVVTSAGEEFAAGTDESNIPEAEREPLPRTSKAEP